MDIPVKKVLILLGEPLALELLFNILVLRKKFSIKKITQATLLANVISNAVVITVMYLISFL